MTILGKVIGGPSPASIALKGTELVLDADADTTITADTDDQIDIKIAGADDFSFKANTFEVQTGSNIDMNGTELILDANGNTSITADTDDQIDFKIAGADDFRMTANSFNVLSGSTLTIDSGATITNSGTANNFGTDPESAYAGVLQSNANFVDQVIFGPSVDGRAWNGLWNKASVFSSLMLATIEDEGSNTEINIWDLTEQSSGAISTTPLATVDLASAATPTAIAACMGYLIVSSEDGIAIIDPHSGAWAERTTGWPRTLSTSTLPALRSNDVQGVAAGLSDQPAHDPRTGGPLPSFACTYVSGAAAETSVIKDDGNVWDITGDGSASGHYGTAIVSGGRVLTNYDDNQLRQVPISRITADQSVNPPYMFTSNEYASIAAAADAADGAGELTALGSGEGLGFVRFPSTGFSATDINSSMNANITRAYNTGYIFSGGANPRGVWLANSKTVDRGLAANTLTENGTVTEAAVESSAELLGYSGWTTSNFLRRAHDTDLDFGTGDFSISVWFKFAASSANEYICHIARPSAGDDVGKISVYMSSGSQLYFYLHNASGSGAAADYCLSPGTVDDGVWHKLDAVRDTTADKLFMYLDGVLIDTDEGPLTSGTMTDSSATFTVGGSSASTPIFPGTNGTYALLRIYATIPTATQVRQMYDAEKGMFVASAECLLQSGSTDAVIDVDVDPLTNKVLVTQTDAITIFDGLVIDSKPTVNSGASEKGKLWGALRSEQNAANAYVTAPAVDQRQVNEMVRGLASDLPAGVDLSKAKAWINQGSVTSTPTIISSFNIKSVTRTATGKYDIVFGTPFKWDTAGGGTAAQVGWVGSLTGGYYPVGYFDDSEECTRFTARADMRHTDNTNYDTKFMAIFFGELENE